MKLLVQNGKLLRTGASQALAVEEPRPPVQEQIDTLEEQVEMSFVPFRLAPLPATTGFRQGGSIYVDNGHRGFRMSMTDLKDLNTKIITTDSASDVDMSNLTVGDFIYERKE